MSTVNSQQPSALLRIGLAPEDPDEPTGEVGMRDSSDRIVALKMEVQSLRSRLADAEEALDSLTGSAAREAVEIGGNKQPIAAPFHLFIDHMREGALLLSDSSIIEHCNEALARIVELPRESIVGRRLGQFLACETEHQVQRLLDSGAGAFESGLRNKSGNTIPVQVTRVPPIAIGARTIRCLFISDLRRERLRLRHEAVVQASKDAIYALSPDLRIETWNRGAETIFGYAPAEIIGKSERDLCPPAELASLDELVQQVQEHGAAVTVDAVRWRKDRSKIRVILSLTPIREISGRTIGYAVVAHDITQRKRTERQLREAMASTSLALAAGRMGTYELDLGTKRCTWSDQVYSLYGLDRATFDPTLDKIRALVHPDDRLMLDECYEKARSTGSFEAELRVRHSDGRYVWLHSRGLVRSNGEDRPLALFGVVADVTERKEAERNQQLLVGELNHRVRNTLATVQAIASQTLRRARSPADFVPSFTGRIQALSRAHTLLTRTAWQGTELDALIREQLLLGSADRIACEGPRVSLEPQTALQLALVLHELGTNARKYGSLSIPQGSVTVIWTLQDLGDSRLLQLTWTERDGPLVKMPETTGFGTLLIERSLQQGRGGQSRISFDPAGLICTIRLQLPRTEMALSAAGIEAAP